MKKLMSLKYKPPYPTAEQEEKDQKAIGRFLQSPEGRTLLENLSNGLGRLNAKVTIELEFMDSVATDVAGEVEPQSPVTWADGRPMTYQAKVGRSPDRPAGATQYLGAAGFTYQYKEGTSEMASTIFHELQHVYFLNQHLFENPAAAESAGDESVMNSWSLGPEGPPVPKVDTYGHKKGDAAKDARNYDAKFLEGLKKFAGDLDAMERCLAQPGVAPTATPGPTAGPAPTASPAPTATPGPTAGPGSRRGGAGAPR